MKKKIKNKLLSTRSQVSKEWKKYREKKEKIENRVISRDRKNTLIQKEYEKTLKKLSKDWKKYSDYKYIQTHDSDIINTNIIGKPQTIKDGKIKTYQIQKGKHSGKIIKDLQKKYDFRYLIFVIKCKTEQGTTIHLSKSFTPESLERIDINNITSEVLQELSFDGYTELKIVSKYIKIVYN